MNTMRFVLAGIVLLIVSVACQFASATSVGEPVVQPTATPSATQLLEVTSTQAPTVATPTPTPTEVVIIKTTGTQYVWDVTLKPGYKETKVKIVSIQPGMGITRVIVKYSGETQYPFELVTEAVTLEGDSLRNISMVFYPGINPGIWSPVIEVTTYKDDLIMQVINITINVKVK